MRLISNEELQCIVGAGEASCTIAPLPNGGSTTACVSNGTSTVTTSYPNGNTTTTITRPDGHGEVITSTVMPGGEGEGGLMGAMRGVGIRIGGSGSQGGKTVVTRTKFDASTGESYLEFEYYDE